MKSSTLELQESLDQLNALIGSTEPSRRILANRENAKKSTGPKTQAGKDRVRFNACKNRLSGHDNLFEANEFPSYLEIGEALVTELRPVGMLEIQLAQRIIDTNWLLNRATATEMNLFNKSMMMSVNEERCQDEDSTRTEVIMAQTAGYRKDCEGPNTLEKSGRQQTRLSRMYFKLIEELERFQTRRLSKAGDTWSADTCFATQWFRGTIEALRLADIADEAAQLEQSKAASELALFCKNEELEPAEQPLELDSKKPKRALNMGASEKLAPQHLPEAKKIA